MIDIHCHILPGVDDGAQEMQTALMMAAMAADDGVRAVIATPHVRWDHGADPYQLHEIQEAAKSFQAALRESNIPVTCFVGAEVLCEAFGAEPLNRETFPCLAETRYALVEFYFDESVQYMEACLQKLIEAGIYPIVAHPERYGAVQRNRDVLTKWTEAGIHLQINKGSPFGQFGRNAKKIAEWILKKRLAAFLATDAHGTRSRTMRIAEECRWLSERYGEDYLYALIEGNPRKIINRELL